MVVGHRRKSCEKHKRRHVQRSLPVEAASIDGFGAGLIALVATLRTAVEPTDQGLTPWTIAYVLFLDTSIAHGLAAIRARLYKTD